MEIAVLLLTILVLLLRIFVPADLLNLFVDYTSEGGLFVVKFHLAAYAIGSVLLLSLFGRPFTLHGADVELFRALLRVCGLLIALTALIVAGSGFGATGFLIDTYLVALLAGLLLLTQTRNARHVAGEAIIIVAILSAIIGIAEMLIQNRLLPFAEGEPVFRPTGLAGHPLALGAQIVLTTGFVTLTRWPLWVKVVLTLVLFVGLAASGARLAMMAGAAQILLLLYFSRWEGLSRRQEKQAKAAAIMFVLVIGGVLVLTLFAGGFLDRFSNTLVDDNFMARVRIYQIFSYVNWRDIFVGMDANDLLALVRSELDIPFIESAPVYITLTLGLPAAVAFAVIVVMFFRRLLSGAPLQAKIAALVFITVDLSNNGLATKNPDIILLTVLMVAFLHPAAEMTHSAEGRRGGRHHVLSTVSRQPARLRV